MANEEKATRRRAGKQMATGTDVKAEVKAEAKPTPKAAPKRALEDLSVEELRNLAKALIFERNEARNLSAKLAKVIEDSSAVGRDAEYRLRRAVEEHNQAIQPPAAKAPTQAPTQ